MSREFELPTAEVQLWRPVYFGGPQWLDERSRGRDSLVVLGRMAPSATIESARAEMDAIAAQLRQEYPATNASFGVITDRLTDRVIGPTTERSLWMLFGSVGFVLLIACANVANLVLARSAGRRTEFSVRTAIGAGKWRLVRQTLTESLVLSLVAGAISLLLAWMGAVALRRLAAGALPRIETAQIDLSGTALPAGGGALQWTARRAPAGRTAVDRKAGAGVARRRPAGAWWSRRTTDAPGPGRGRNHPRGHPAVRGRPAHPQLPPRPGDKSRIRFEQRHAAPGGSARNV